MKVFHTLFLILLLNNLFAQQIEGYLDASLQPTTDVGRYYAITEKKAGRWYRVAYYLPEKSIAISGSYKDEDCKIPDGEVIWYYPNKQVQSLITYRDGEKNGLSIMYHENGMISDSVNYLSGRKKGIGLSWNSEGYQVDSSNFDGEGNGVQVTWFPGGNVSSAGRFINDTTKDKRWVYYHTNGTVLAYEDYKNGKKKFCSCFDEKGTPLDSIVCAREEEANFPGSETAWRRYLERNLDAAVPVRNRAPLGTYTVIVIFVVDRNGKLTDIKPLTSFGYGMEEEVVRLLKRSPPWKPAFQFGRNVKAYRKQPVTFVVTKD